ncbi:MAG: aldo/keto reductase [Kiritimatiellales bacterium]
MGIDKTVDPARVPARTLANGSVMPAVGMGTFGSDKYDSATIAAAVIVAAEIGYRHFDCASVYGNEAEIGTALKTVVKSGVAREELWVTSKVWNDMHGDGDVIRSCKKSLSDLQLDYFDLFLVHWPFPNFHPKGCSVDFHDDNAKPYIHENYMKTWTQMERLVNEGLVRNIGTSNMTVPKMKLLLRDCRIRPAVNEMELHPHFQQPELFNFLVNEKIQPVGFCPVGSPSRPERDRTPEDTADVDDPVIVDIAKNHNVHPAVICIKWAQQHGQIPIPFAVKRPQLFGNLNAVVNDPLSADEMAAIKKIDRGCRLIKGQVFCWKRNQDWKDLWDLDGVIKQ